MSIPNWYEGILLALAAWRVWHLLANDEILDRPRRYALRLGSAWQKVGDPTPEDYRLAWAKFLACPYCLGAWLGIAWWIAFQVDEHWALVVAAPFAISAGVIAAHKLLTQEE